MMSKKLNNLTLIWVGAEPLFPSLKSLRRMRRGSIISRFFRHVFSHSKINKILGTNLAILAMIGLYLPTKTNAYTEPEMSVIEAKQTEFITQNSVINPVKTFKLTQGFSFFHPGVDIDGVTGDPINPIMKGVVSDVSHSKYAYGNAIIIDHGGGMSSLYAHLSKIFVKPGDVVDTNTTVGEMGATGHAFGDHLHLEVHDHGKAINPLSVIPGYTNLDQQ
jgi:murein DD-endopeptidase MepM/ murein hydrolase activator NlpD